MAANMKRTKGQTTIYKTLHRKLKTEQHEPNWLPLLYVIILDCDSVFIVNSVCCIILSTYHSLHCFFFLLQLSNSLQN
jgi:hypothetical protein